MYIKAILSYYFSPIRLAKIQRTLEWCDVAALREHVFSYISIGSSNWHNLYREQTANHFQNSSGYNL